MSVPKLRKLAREAGVKGYSKALKPTLVESLLATGAELNESEPTEPEPTEEPQEPTAALEAEPGTDDLLPDQYRRIIRADTDKLHVVLADPNLETHLAKAITREIERREERDAKLRTAQDLKGTMELYTVTRGGRFVLPGQITELPAGSVIGPLTHNLAEVRAQGIEFQPLKSLEVVEDQMGRKITKVA